MLPARPSRERPVSAQGGLGFISLSVGQRVPLRILYGVTSFESGKDYLLVSYHLVPTLAMRGIYYSLRLQPLRRTPLWLFGMDVIADASGRNSRTWTCGLFHPKEALCQNWAISRNMVGRVGVEPTVYPTWRIYSPLQSPLCVSTQINAVRWKQPQTPLRLSLIMLFCLSILEEPDIAPILWRDRRHRRFFLLWSI